MYVLDLYVTVCPVCMHMHRLICSAEELKRKAEPCSKISMLSGP